MTPECDYTDKRPSQSSHFGGFRWRDLWECGRGAKGCISQVARWAIRKNRSAFEGMCRLKSDQAMHKEAAAATSPESCKAPAKELLSWRNRFKDSLNKTPRNQAQQKPSENAGFGEGLEVVVVRVIDDFPVVE